MVEKTFKLRLLKIEMIGVGVTTNKSSNPRLKPSPIIIAIKATMRVLSQRLRIRACLLSCDRRGL